MNLKKDTVVTGSQFGARGFIYPSEKQFTITADCEAKSLQFMASGGKEAYLVETCYVDGYQSEKAYAVVWVEK